MSSARAALIVLGIAFALAGVVVAAVVDALIGIGVLVVGAFLLALPFTRTWDEE